MPTTAAVMADKGAVNFMSPRVASTAGPPTRINRNEGKKVKNVATREPTTAPWTSASPPSGAWAQAPTNPTNATTIIKGPGVVSPSAKPSITCGGVNHEY